MSDSDSLSSYSQAVLGKRSSTVANNLDNKKKVDKDGGAWTAVASKQKKSAHAAKPSSYINNPVEFPALDLPSSDDEVEVTRVVAPRQLFAKIVQDKTSRVGFPNKQMAALKPPLPSNTMDEATVAWESSYQIRSAEPDISRDWLPPTDKNTSM